MGLGASCRTRQSINRGARLDGKALLFTHIPASRILRYDPQTGDCTVYRENTNHHQWSGFRREWQPVRLLLWRTLYRPL